MVLGVMGGGDGDVGGDAGHDGGFGCYGSGDVGGDAVGTDDVVVVLGEMGEVVAGCRS